MKKAKFKMTEIGLIPEDWEVKRLGEICENIRNGYNYDFREHGTYPMSRIETISSGEINYKRVALIEHEPPSEYKLKVGDILYSHINSLPYIGNIAQYDGADCLYHGMNLLLLRPNDAIDYMYLKYLLKSETMRGKARSAAKVAINQASISTRDLSEFQVTYPPLPEQKAIAEALSDVDELLAAMTTLIEKKRAIKQGTMQDLLTGKKRLVGFKNSESSCLCASVLNKDAGMESGGFNTETQRLRGTEFKMTEIGLIPEDWEVKRLGDVLTIGNGKDYKHLSCGTIPVYGTGGLMTYVSEWLYDGATVCIGRKGTIDVPQYHEGKIWTVDTLYYTYGFKEVDIKFLYYLFLRIDWLSYNSATGVPSLTAKAIYDIEVALPPLHEQKAIAEVLSDMDAEIEALEAKRAKYESIKQGMMQELLTGKTRLV